MAINKNKFSTEKLVTAGIMTALVIVLQTMANYIPTLTNTAGAAALIPIVLGSAVCGVWIGGWLGFVFGLVVLLGPSGFFFMQFNIPATILICLLKGAAAGFAAGAVYRLFETINRYFAVIMAALVCPVVNTSIFILGCLLFFMEDAVAITGNEAGGFIAFFLMAMANFGIEIGLNIIFSPVIFKLLNIKFGKSKNK